MNWYQLRAHPSARSPKGKRPLDEVRSLLTAAAARLARVTVEQRDFMAILDRYDKSSTFFYLDPPYVSYQPNGHYAPLSTERRTELFDRLTAIKGRFLMSFDDCPEIRRLARARKFLMRRVEVVYTIGGRAERKPSSELLLANFPLAN